MSFSPDLLWRNIRKSCLMLLALATTSTAGLEINAQQKIEFELENGMQVILLPLPTAKSNTLVVLYDFGNHCDLPGKSGIAHLSEHLYVTAATENTPARNVNEYIAAYPDGWNAQTGDDYTVLAAVVKADRTDSELADAADRMRKLVVEQADIDRELPRIESELNNMYERMPMLAVQNAGRHYVSPLANEGRRGGRIEELKTIELAEIRNWLDRYYKPGNATLVLAGVFDADEVRATIEKRFGAIPRGEEPVINERPAVADQRVYNIDVDPFQPGQPARVGFTFRAPQCDDPLYAAYMVHVTRMTMAGMKSSKNMQDIPFMIRPMDDPDFFYASVPVGEDETPEQALERLDKMLTEQRDTELKPHHVKQTENQLALFLGTIDMPAAMLAFNPYGAAFSLGRREQMGLDSEQLKSRFAALDAKQMQQAGEKYFAESNRITVIARPAR